MHFTDAKGILTGSGGHYGMNVYRGCSHGCVGAAIEAEAVRDRHRVHVGSLHAL